MLLLVLLLVVVLLVLFSLRLLLRFSIVQLFYSQALAEGRAASAEAAKERAEAQAVAAEAARGEMEKAKAAEVDSMSSNMSREDTIYVSSYNHYINTMISLSLHIFFLIKHVGVF